MSLQMTRLSRANAVKERPENDHSQFTPILIQGFEASQTFLSTCLMRPSAAIGCVLYTG
jgi:hypothetical protein